MPQFLRPDADSIDGNWTNNSGSNVNLYASLNETSASDAEYIQSPLSPLGEVCKIGLGNPTGTPAQPFTVSYRFNNLGGAQLGVRLLQGTTEIAAWSETAGSGWTTQDRTLTGPQFAAITDFTDLFIEFNAGTGGDPTLKLSLDFTATGTLDSKVTLSRASAGTSYNSAGLLVTAASNGARFDYNPTTFAPLGLLIENSRTNYCIQSETLGSWNTQSGNDSITADAIAAPDGTTTADLMTCSSTGSQVGRYKDISGLPSAQPVIYTHYVKKSVGDWCALMLYTSTGYLTWFNLTTGTVGTSQHDAASITPIGSNGWYRLMVRKSNAGSNASPGIRISNDNGDTTNAVAGLAIYAWGAQVESGQYGLFPTSYIKTTTVAVTRAMDDYSIGGTAFTNMFNATEGTFVIEADWKQNAFEILFCLENAARNDRYLSEQNPSFALNFSQVGGSAEVSISSLGTVLNDTPFKYAFAYKVNNFGACMNAGTVGTDSSAATLVTPDHFGFFYYQYNVGTPQRGHYRKLQYYNVRKTNAELQTLTT